LSKLLSWLSPSSSDDRALNNIPEGVSHPGLRAERFETHPQVDYLSHGIFPIGRGSA
jgi:hypothetical protein